MIDNTLLSKLPIFKNAGIEQYVYSHAAMLDIYQAQQFVTAFYRKIPQMNEQTKIQMVQPGYRDIVVAEWPNNWRNMLPRTVWVIAPGVKAWLTRQRVRIHAWLVNHRYHPADKPAGWLPWTSDAGKMPILPDGAPLPTTFQRTIELQWFGMNFGMWNYAGGEHYSTDYAICCAYDGATDTLYVRE